jgi:hypothetical protein
MRAVTIAMWGSFLAAPSIAREGTAILAGKVEDIRGVGVAGTSADLHGEQEPYERHRAIADTVGMFRFLGLITGEYTLELQQSGFTRLLVKGIHISEGEQKTLPTLRIDVSSLDCSFHAVIDYLRLGREQGNLTGRVEQGPYGRNSKPIGNTQVTLICSKNTVCAAAKTDSQGDFSFQNLSPGSYSIRANHAGFYPLEEPGYEVQEGLESIYSMYLERCPLGNCDPRLRPKKPPARCE